MMAIRTYFKKGTAQQAKKSITSPRLANRLSKAIEQLENDDLDRLERMGKVRKIRTVGDYDIYMYRVTPSKRIVFSPVAGKNYIHDVISLSDPSQVRSLIPVQGGIPARSITQELPIHSIKEAGPVSSEKKIK